MSSRFDISLLSIILLLIFMALADLAFSQGLGVNQSNPSSLLDVNGNASIGTAYSGTNAAPSNGLLVEGKLGIGTTTVSSKVDIEGNVSIGSAYSGTVAAPV